MPRVLTLVLNDPPYESFADDLHARGIRRDEVLGGVGFVARAEPPALLRGYKQVWQW